MPYVKITAQALAAIESRREFPPPKHDPHPLRRCDQDYEAWLGEDVIAYLNEKALKGETISDTIIRLFALLATRGRLI